MKMWEINFLSSDKGIIKNMQDMIYIHNKIAYSMNKEIMNHNSLVNTKHYLGKWKKVKKII